MSGGRSLAELLDASARRFPDKPAVALPGGKSLSYRGLAALSGRLRDRLWRLGVRPGDRVGLRLHKSIESVASIFGILKAGAAYVPVDAESPAARGAFILNDCAVKVVVTERALEDDLRRELAALGASPAILAIDPDKSAAPLEALLSELDAASPAAHAAPPPAGNDDVAYILYTSGSTGRPKGVVLTHGNARSFTDWCAEVFRPSAEDRFSSHAPFHFDLSIFDLYVSLEHGATLVLIDEALGKDPVKLASAIASERISIWYSTPSILSLLANYGKLPRYDFSALRIVLFAGEVFPIPQFQALRALWPQPRYFNLYGPTETNVCTWYEVPADDTAVAALASFPIGAICPPNRGVVVDEQDLRVPAGTEGELLVCGPNVMRGYWNLPDANARAFFVDAAGERWYRTGDIVVEEPAIGFTYRSRRDRMVKRRGYRVELGEIEAAMSRHPDILEAAVISIPDPESGVKVRAFVAPRDGAKLGVIALKAHAGKSLPPYMIPDVFSVLERLPRTSTDKIDYQTLKSMAG